MTSACMAYYALNLESRLMQAKLFKAAPDLNVIKICWNIMEIKPKTR
jgi:hypothetical protein